MASIFERGLYQFRVLIRRKGTTLCRTFETRAEAREWAAVTEGRVTGGEIIQRQTPVTLAQACDWFAARIGKNPNARNERGHTAYWRGSKFAAWAVSAIHDWSLIEWRDEVLEGEEIGAQTCIHRLNTLGKIITTWGRAHRIVIENPVKPGVRPGKPDGRERRLYPDEEDRLLEAADRGTRPWLRAAIVIALETAMRQGELVDLTWERVNLERRFVDLVRTKNDRPRRVPLSERAAAALESLRPKAGRVLPVQTGVGLFHAFRDARSVCGSDDLRWHDLRHEAIGRLFELTNFRDHEIMAISGHLTPSMLARYTHLRADRLASRLPGGKDNRRGV